MEKDIAEKILADYNDVFADIVNVLFFDGEQVVAADDLENVKDRRFEEVTQRLPLPGKGGTSMCDVLDKVENRGIEKGIELGKLEGMTQIYYTEMHYSADQIAKKLNAPVDKIQELINGFMEK